MRKVLAKIASVVKAFLSSTAPSGDRSMADHLKATGVAFLLFALAHIGLITVNPFVIAAAGYALKILQATYTTKI